MKNNREIMLITKARIKLLCKRDHITIIQLNDELGFPKRLLYKCVEKPLNISRLVCIARRFQVSLDYLCGLSDDFTS